MQKVISTLLSLLILLSSSGIAYAQHFCGDFEMISTLTLGEKQLSCGMAMEKETSSECDDTFQKMDCCDNQYTTVDTDDTFTKTSFDVDLNKNFVAAFVSVFVLQTIANYPSHTNFFAEYNPPPLDQDFQVLYETFLI